MIMETMIEAGMQVFKEKMTAFCSGQAEGPLNIASAESIASGIQLSLSEVGKATFRVYLESKDAQQDIVRFKEETFRFKYVSPKTFESLWGPIVINRRLYQNASDSKTHVPLDAQWGMVGEHMMLEVREAVAYSCAHMTPEETHGLLKKTRSMFTPHPTQIKRCLEKIEGLVSPEREVVDACIRQKEYLPEETRVLAASMDGVNVLLDEKGKKKGRPTERPKGGTADKDQDESASTYKNATVGSITFYGDVPEGGKTPQRLSGVYTAHMPEDKAPTFKGRFEDELAAIHAHLPDTVIKVCVNDGARNIWKYIENNPLFDGYEKIVDYWHAVEHLSLAAEALFGKGTLEGKRWYKTYATKLLEEDDGVKRILRSMNYHQNVLVLSKARREVFETQQTFFRRNKDKMHYAGFRSRGLPIGSGPVEAACKSIVKNRLCRSGMRWSRKGGQRILDLRTYVKSNRWDSFWNQYKILKQSA